MTKKESPINVVVVGAGRIGKRHASIIASHPEFNLIALIDPQPNGLEGYNVPVFHDFTAFAGCELKADVVAIASPNGYHAEQAIQALEYGAHVVLEKPMALHKTDAEKVIFTALKHHKKVFVVMQNRYSPPSQWLKEMVSENRLGKIYQVQINCFWNRDERYYQSGSWHGTKDLDGGVLFTQFSHFIDMLYWVFGDLKNIQTKIQDYKSGALTEFEDSGIVTFDLEEGGQGSLNFSTATWDANFESSLTVIGEKGTLKIAGQYMNEVVYCHVQDYTFVPLAETNPPNDYGPFKGSAANHTQVYENVHAVISGKQAIATNALEGLKVVEMIERIYKAK